MWAAHQVHHSSEDYNFTTALRQSVLQMYTSWVCLVFLLTMISGADPGFQVRGGGGGGGAHLKKLRRAEEYFV